MVHGTKDHGGSIDTTDTTSRRALLKATGAAGIAGLGGCIGPIGGGPGTVTFGVLSPMSGPYKGLGPEQRKGAKLAVEWINDNDEFNFTVEAVYEDTGTDPETASRKADKVVKQDGASFLMGAISSSVALELNSFAKREQVIYTPGAAAIPITGAKCNEYVFRFETNTAQVAEACAPWTVDNLGGKAWFHIADYAYGQSVLTEWRKRMKGKGNFREMGVTTSQLGASNFGSFITQIKNSDAEVVVVGMTGGDLITFIKQGKSQGLFDAVDVMTTTASFQVIRGALKGADAGVYSGVRYVPKLQTGDNQEFVSRFEEEHDGTPDNFARVGFDSIRMVARGIKQAGSSNPTQVKDALSGLEMPTIFGPNAFRECDHQATNPVWVGRNVGGGGQVTNVKLLKKVEGADAIPACGKTGCNL